MLIARASLEYVERPDEPSASSESSEPSVGDGGGLDSTLSWPRPGRGSDSEGGSDVNVVVDALVAVAVLVLSSLLLEVVLEPSSTCLAKPSPGQSVSRLTIGKR